MPDHHRSSNLQVPMWNRETEAALKGEERFTSNYCQQVQHSMPRYRHFISLRSTVDSTLLTWSIY